MKKSKSLEQDDSMEEVRPGVACVEKEDEYEYLCKLVNVIAQPLAPRKLAKKIYKLVKKAVKSESYCFGIHDVNKALRKGETGIVILAGDVTPVDIYSHIPGYCEEKNIPYVYVPSKEHLAIASGFKRCIIVALVKENPQYAEYYNQMKEAINLLPLPDGAC